MEDMEIIQASVGDPKFAFFAFPPMFQPFLAKNGPNLDQHFFSNSVATVYILPLQSVKMCNMNPTTHSRETCLKPCFWPIVDPTSTYIPSDPLYRG